MAGIHSTQHSTQRSTQSHHVDRASSHAYADDELLRRKKLEEADMRSRSARKYDPAKAIFREMDRKTTHGDEFDED